MSSPRQKLFRKFSVIEFAVEPRRFDDLARIRSDDRQSAFLNFAHAHIEERGCTRDPVEIGFGGDELKRLSAASCERARAAHAAPIGEP